VTKAQQRIKLDNNVVLTDTPGFLWPKLNPPSCGYRLAITAAIKDTVFDYADIAMFAADYFIKAYPERIKARYQIDDLPDTEIELLEMIARQRAFIKKGGLADLHKASEILVNEFRSGLLGRVSLETPEMVSLEIVAAEAEAAEKAREKAEREDERQARARRKYARKHQK
ncbi:MAG: YlqF/YawG family GTPase, partial [Aeromonas sp.]